MGGVENQPMLRVEEWEYCSLTINDETHSDMPSGDSDLFWLPSTVRLSYTGHGS